MRLKRIAAFSLAVVMALSTVSCGKSGKKTEESKPAAENTDKKSGNDKKNNSGKIEDGMEVVNLDFDDGDTASSLVRVP